ncbi:MAG: flagellar filament capping protein FliD [Eubacterium sp.]|nr:flagellar filament capping protein FliD [Eubacterium sp.]
MAVVDNAYNYYMTTYGKSLSPTRYDTHKKSDLRNVYNSILKVNKESPLYKLVNPDEAQRFAIDIKEASRGIQNALSSLNENFDEDEGDFKKKIAYSTDDSRVSVEYLGEGESAGGAGSFDIDVEKLAQTQVNTSAFLNNSGLSLAPGDYSFDLKANQTAFTFEFSVKVGDTNYNINSRLANLITNAKLGINAQVIENANGQSAIRMESQQTGLTANETSLFEISADETERSKFAMNILQLDNVSRPASNSSFTLNGAPHSSYSNNFTINKAFEITLHEPTSDGPVTIDFKSDAEAVADNVTTLVDAYNNLADVANRYSGTNTEMNKLKNLVTGVAQRYTDDLMPMGLEFDEDGSINIDRALLTDAASDSNWKESLDTLNRFKNTVSRLAVRTSLNPIDFVDKKICAYKNPGHNFTAPYATSQYAGMLFSAGR